MDHPAKNFLCTLFNIHFHQEAVEFEQLPVSGSNRKYFRISTPEFSALGAYNPDNRENEAFLYLSRHFASRGLPVPALLEENLAHQVYLVQDLGDSTLFSMITDHRTGEGFPEQVTQQYHEAVKILPQFQVNGHKGLDYSHCYPRRAFDHQSIYWDLNYFKYYFLKLAGIVFDEQDLEDDFQRLIKILLDTPTGYFLYRDFQSRNIMINQDSLFFIDYQGGRMGSPAYDLASLLFDAKADLPQELRNELKEDYLLELNKLTSFPENNFNSIFYPYCYIRLMQAMGAYGFRGFYEKKELFLQSIPFALHNLGWLLDHYPLPGSLRTLSLLLHAVCSSDYLKSLGKPGLKVLIRSFSYKNGIPVDNSGHGGGFVFDCRALPNPGRYPEYQKLTGKDAAVIHFLEKEKEVEDFLFSIYHIVDQSVKNYLERGFTGLTVNFGCTGGQHRSVFLAEKLKTHLMRKFHVEVHMKHTEIPQDQEKTAN